MKKKPETEEKEIQFEEAFQRLEAIVEELDEGGLPLDELEQRFEEGLKLAQFCNDRLSGIEKRVKMLMEQPNGEIESEEFDSDEE